jgi:hypothetical protein
VLVRIKRKFEGVKCFVHTNRLSASLWPVMLSRPGGRISSACCYFCTGLANERNWLVAVYGSNPTTSAGEKQPGYSAL